MADDRGTARVRIARVVEAAEKHQIVLYLGAIAAAVVFGLVPPETAGRSLEHAIEPVRQSYKQHAKRSAIQAIKPNK